MHSHLNKQLGWALCQFLMADPHGICSLKLEELLYLGSGLLSQGDYWNI